MRKQKLEKTFSLHLHWRGVKSSDYSNSSTPILWLENITRARVVKICIGIGVTSRMPRFAINTSCWFEPSLWNGNCRKYPNKQVCDELLNLIVVIKIELIELEKRSTVKKVFMLSRSYFWFVILYFAISRCKSIQVT